MGVVTLLAARLSDDDAKRELLLEAGVLSRMNIVFYL